LGDNKLEIKAKGDKVIIRTIPDVTIRSYVKGMDLNYTAQESTSINMVIDKGKYFAFPVNRVDQAQADINFLEKWSSDASEQMKIAIDSDVLNAVYADAHADNIGTTAGKVSGGFNLGTTGSPVTLTKANILDYIVDCNTVLDEQNVPETDRYLVLPNWACNLIKKSDLKDASLTGDSVSVLRNGRIGRIDNFTLYKSNNLSMVTDGVMTCNNIMFGHKSAITFATQVTDMETLVNPKDFGKLVRGLQVYGYKVIKPESLGVLYARKGY